MRFLEIMLETLSPTVVTARISVRGFLKALDHIPASMLRGAILSELYRSGVVDKSFLESERYGKPSVITSYAYPITSEGKKSYPGHPFMYKCKVCGSIENYLGEIINRLELDGGLREKVPISCRYGHKALESFHSRFYPSEDGGKVPTSRFICTGVSKRRASSEAGLLFEYEAISPGRRFWATLALPNEVTDYIDGLEIYIGRGISRGFGRSRIVKLREIILEDVAMQVEQSLTSGGYIALYASSPLISCIGSSYAPYPQSIDLSRAAAMASINEEGSLKIRAVYGRADFQIGGWDMAKNSEKPSLWFAARPGSIAVAEYSCSSIALAALSLLGTVECIGDTFFTGVNMLHPLRSHPIFTSGGD